MRLAYFTPLPPSKSGIADYNAELMPYLARGAELTVFVQREDELNENLNREEYAVRNAASFDELHRDDPFDLCIYHQGNNPFHEYIYERALATPGLLVLHEHCLHHLIAGKTLARGDAEGYWNELFFAYGNRGARLAEMRIGGTVSSEYQQFLFPLNRRLVASSLGLIVHNAYSFAQLEGVREGCPVEIIPHHLSPKNYELDEMDKVECRRSLGVPEDAWVVASLGFVTQSKRIPVVLAAFKKLLSVMPNSIYLIIGEDHPTDGVAPLIEEMGLGDKVRITGYTTEADFFRYLKTVDVVVNLRYPTAGETSGTLIRSLGAGKPVIVSDYGQFGELPDDCCLKVRLGPDEERELYLQLRALAYRPTLRERLSRRSSEWIRRECEISRSAARYLAIAERIIEREKRWRERPSRALISPRFDFIDAPLIKIDREAAEGDGYTQHIIDLIALIPAGGKDDRLLILNGGDQIGSLIERYGEYGEILATRRSEGEGLRYSNSHFDVALFGGLIEDSREDTIDMLIEMNRVLKWGGLLILTTSSMVGDAPLVLGSAGFKVIKRLTGRGRNDVENLFVGRKQSLQFDKDPDIAS
jgi:glycosyltransferase involved in cell wall biosynthesis